MLEACRIGGPGSLRCCSSPAQGNDATSNGGDDSSGGDGGTGAGIDALDRDEDGDANESIAMGAYIVGDEVIGAR